MSVSSYTDSSLSPASPIASRKPGRIPALDGLRGIAILLVLLRHSVVGTPAQSSIVRALLASGRLAWSGVDLFFVLSGFLIGGILVDARDSPRYFKTFYLRRAYRILPIYGTLLLIFLAHHLPFHLLPGKLGEASAVNIPPLAYLTFTQNFWMAHLGWYGAAAMAVTWSLAVEEQFYLTIPLVVRHLERDALVIFATVVVVAAPFARVLSRHALEHGDFACYVLMPCRADALCIGVLCAVLVRSEFAWSVVLGKKGILYSVTGALLIGVAYMTYLNLGQFSAGMTIFGYSWLALFFGGCLLIAVSAKSGILAGILRTPALRALGTISYCTYLTHFVLIQESRRLFALRYPAETSYLLGGASGILISLIIASASWRFFERPLLRRGHRYSY